MLNYFRDLENVDMDTVESYVMDMVESAITA